MSNEFGNDWRIKIGDGATPEVFTVIGGETSLDWTRTSQEQDISDKDTGTYGASSFSQQKITFKIAGNLKLPDAGLAELDAASKASPPQVMVQVMRGAVVKYKGLVSVGNFSVTAPTVGPVTYTADMVNAAAPITDDLTATA